MDLGFSKNNGWFRYRSAAIIIEDECVLFAKNDIDDDYYSIGGGVKLGETAEEAVKREVLEETGIEYEVDRLVFIHENIFEGAGSLQDLKCHEIAMYFLMKSKGNKYLNSNSYTQQGIKEYMHFIPIKDLKNYKAYPIFFQDKLQCISQNIEHIISINNKIINIK